MISPSLANEEIKKRQGGNCYPPRGPCSYCAASRAEKACKKAAQDNQKRCSPDLPVPCSSILTPPSASKARQVKRGVKEVVKGIRKGEKGQVIRCILHATLRPCHYQVTRAGR